MATNEFKMGLLRYNVEPDCAQETTGGGTAPSSVLQIGAFWDDLVPRLINVAQARRLRVDYTDVAADAERVWIKAYITIGIDLHTLICLMNGPHPSLVASLVSQRLAAVRDRIEQMWRRYLSIPAPVLFQDIITRRRPVVMGDLLVGLWSLTYNGSTSGGDYDLTATNFATWVTNLETALAGLEDGADDQRIYRLFNLLFGIPNWTTPTPTSDPNLVEELQYAGVKGRTAITTESMAPAITDMANGIPVFVHGDVDPYRLTLLGLIRAYTKPDEGAGDFAFGIVQWDGGTGNLHVVETDGLYEPSGVYVRGTLAVEVSPSNINDAPRKIFHWASEACASSFGVGDLLVPVDQSAKVYSVSLDDLARETIFKLYQSLLAAQPSAATITTQR
jgi:hypothetical protein